MPALFFNKTRSKVAPLPTASIPTDLVHAILAHLPQPDVLVFAAVCRAWRTAAMNSTHFYWHVKLYLPREYPLATLRKSTMLSRAQRAVRRARAADTRVSLELNVGSVSPSDYPRVEPGVFGWRRALRARMLVRTIAVARAALPFCVRFSIRIEDEIAPGIEQLVLSLLSGSAPRLRYFEYWDPRGVEVPVGLFSGCSPCLRRIALYSVSLPAASLQAFERVEYVSLFDFKSLSVDVRLHFPHVQDFYVGMRSGLSGVRLDLGQEPLERLRITCLAGWKKFVAARIPDVRDLETTGIDMVSLDPQFAALSGPRELSVSIGFDTTIKCHERRLKIYAPEKSIWSRIAPMSALITKLSLDQLIITQFFEIMSSGYRWVPLRFPCLAVFVFSVVKMPVWSDTLEIECPALRSVELNKMVGFHSIREPFPEIITLSIDDVDAMARSLASVPDQHIEILLHHPSLTLDFNPEIPHEKFTFRPYSL